MVRTISVWKQGATIQAKIAGVDDLKKRKMSSVGNLLRQNLTAIETI
jgi:hypothetical protein